MGYAGGTTSDPTYRRLGDHAETVEVDYDPTVITYGELLGEFWRAHDARRAATSGQYRSAIFWRTDEERRAAELAMAGAGSALGPVRTSLEPLTSFTRAEDYHQKYYLRAHRDIASALRRCVADEAGFADSTAAARANAWIAGHGELSDIARDLSLLGLPEREANELAALVALRSRRPSADA